jgi:hypothetical protein
VCGRTITWRARWRDDWDEVRHCSDACRRRGRRPVDDELEAAIWRLLEGRRRGATICPSDAARAVGDEEGWRDLMEPARAAARRLVAAGQVEITQKGRVVDGSTAKGPIRIRRPGG